MSIALSAPLIAAIELVSRDHIDWTRARLSWSRSDPRSDGASTLGQYVRKDEPVDQEPVPGLTIRDATADDWCAIWPFLRDIVRAGETYTWRTDVREAEARDQWFRPAPWRTFVAVDADGNVVGTAKIGPNQDGPGSHVANASYMVDPAHAGSGVGRALATHTIAAARADGYRAMQFNAVVESNKRAVRLWESLGFETLATVPDAFQHPVEGFVGLQIMYRRL